MTGRTARRARKQIRAAPRSRPIETSTGRRRSLLAELILQERRQLGRDQIGLCLRHGHADTRVRTTYRTFSIA